MDPENEVIRGWGPLSEFLDTIEQPTLGSVFEGEERVSGTWVVSFLSVSAHVSRLGDACPPLTLEGQADFELITETDVVRASGIVQIETEGLPGWRLSLLDSSAAEGAVTHLANGDTFDAVSATRGTFVGREGRELNWSSR